MTVEQRKEVLRLLNHERCIRTDRAYVLGLDSLRNEPLSGDEIEQLTALANAFPAKTAKHRRQF